MPKLHYRMFCLFVVLSFFPLRASADNFNETVRENLRMQVEAAGVPFKTTIAGEIIYSKEALPQFYEASAYLPVWVGKKLQNRKIKELMDALMEAELEGLNPDDYHLVKIQHFLERLKNDRFADELSKVDYLIQLELLLSDAFMMYGSHLLAGRVNPETIDSEWYANRRGINMAEVLQHTMESGKISRSLHQLSPNQPDYLLLKKALEHYRQIAARGVWETIPAGPKLEKGISAPRVTLLKKRIHAEFEEYQPPNDSANSESAEIFDENLESWVLKFQSKNGLEADGMVGPETLAALNVSAANRIRQIEINMERWRWLPEDLGKKHILVNMANFEAQVVEKNKVVMNLRVIVGRSYRRTPVFSDRITYLVFNPYWNVPYKLAVEDKLPLLQKDPEYLQKQNMSVLKILDGKEIPVNPGSIDWRQYSKSNFPFKLRQAPGPLNALGQVKFMFPNQFNVYLHDTPDRSLFEKTTRSFSSGCIRIEKPLELAAYLLKDESGWEADKIADVIKKNEPTTVFLKTPVPIHLLYWTAFVDKNNDINFRNDIYGRDKKLIHALYEAAPKSN